MTPGADRRRWPPAAASLLLLTAVLVACARAPAPPPTGGGPPTGLPAAAAVVSAHPIATNAGLAILQAGGSAADAAIAVAATLSVVEPWFSSVLGGGTWALYYDASDGGVTSLDGVGPIPSLATVDDYRGRAGDAGVHQSNVPGAWDGWMLWLERYGRLELGEVLAPAIAVARGGYVVYPQMQVWIDAQTPFFAQRPDTAAIYAPNGVPLRVGQVVHQHGLADTFEALVAAYDEARPLGRAAAIQAARDHYYRGPIADAIVRFSDEQPEGLRGYFTHDDFATFEAAIVAPVHLDLPGGLRVHQNPPNSQGITMLVALAVLQGFDLAALTPDHPDAIHLQVEALKLAFEQRHRYVGDPDCVPDGVDVDRLLSGELAAELRSRMALDRALTWDEAAGGLVHADADVGAMPDADPFVTGTSTFHVVDRDGNAAAVTTSLGAQLYVVGDTGVHLNNRMRFVALEDGDPNQLRPGCKVRHTSNPYLVTRDGAPYLLGGNTGADTQVQGQLQQLLHVIAFGLSAQEAIARPRFLTTAFPATTYPFAVDNRLQLAAGFDLEVRAALEARGHVLVPRLEGGRYGVAHMLEVGRDGRVVGVATDPGYGTSAGGTLGGD